MSEKPVMAWLVVQIEPSMRYEAVGIFPQREAVVEGPRLKVTVMGMHGKNYQEAERGLRAWTARWYPWLKIP